MRERNRKAENGWEREGGVKHHFDCRVPEAQATLCIHTDNCLPGLRDDNEDNHNYLPRCCEILHGCSLSPEDVSNDSGDPMTFSLIPNQADIFTSMEENVRVISQGRH